MFDFDFPDEYDFEREIMAAEALRDYMKDEAALASLEERERETD